MSSTKNWLNLSRFGLKLVVTPKTEIRSQVALIQVKDQKLLEKTLNQPLITFLQKLKNSNKFAFVHNEHSAELTFMYKSKGNLSLADIKEIVPYNKEIDFVEMDVADIYLQNPMSAAEKNQWQSIFELNNQKKISLYQTKVERPYPSGVTLTDALKAFNKMDLGWNKIPLMLQSTDPLPLNDLDQYGYDARSAMVRYFVDKEAAINSGFKDEDIEPVTLKNQLVISVNSTGEVLALKDITQIPELTNYNISNHDGWGAYNSLPQHFVEIRELNKSINKHIDSIVVNLRSDELSEKHKALLELQAFMLKMNDCLYSFDENSIPSVLAPFGIQTYALQNTENEWKVWSYNNQTLDIEEYEIKEKLDDLMKNIQTNINNLRTFDPYSVTDSTFDRDIINESLSDIGSNIGLIDFTELKQSLSIEPKVVVKTLAQKINYFINQTKVKPTAPEPVIRDSLIKLALMRKVKHDYLQQITKLKEQRLSLSEAKTTNVIADRIEKATHLKVESDYAYLVEMQKYEAQAYEIELSLSQLSIASTRLNNIYDTFFNAIIEQNLDNNELDNFLHGVVTDQDMADEMQMLLDEYKEFQSTVTSHDLEVYFLSPDISEEPNYLWNDAINEFDVLHFYDEEADIKAAQDFELSVLSSYSAEKVPQPQLNENVFKNSTALLDKTIEKLILSHSESISKNHYTFQSSLPSVLSNLHQINNQFTALGNGDQESVAKQYLSDENIEKLHHLLDQESYKGFDQRIDVAHILLDLSRNLKNQSATTETLLNQARLNLDSLILDQLKQRTLPGHAIASAIAFVANNDTLSLNPVLSNNQLYVLNKSENYVPKVIDQEDFKQGIHHPLTAIDKKNAVSMAYKAYLQDFYTNALGSNKENDIIHNAINEQHKFIFAALSYVSPTYNELNAPKDSNIANVIKITDEAVKLYLSEGSSLHVEPEQNIRSLAVYSSTIASDTNFIRLLPMDLGQRVNVLQNQKSIMTNGVSTYDHILSSNPISQDKLNFEQLKTVILNRILAKEAVPKYETSFKTDLAIKHLYENTSSFLPLRQTDMVAENDFGSIFKSQKVLDTLALTPDTNHPTLFNQSVLNESLLRSFEARSVEFWKTLVERSKTFTPASQLNIIHHPERINEFEFPELDLYITLSPSTEMQHGSVNLYASGEKIPREDQLIVKFSLKELALSDRRFFKAFDFTENAPLSLSDQFQHIINAVDSEYKIFNTINAHKNILFNNNLADFKSLSLLNTEGQYIDSTAKTDLVEYLSQHNTDTYLDLINNITNYVQEKEVQQSFDHGSKIVLANDNNELVISVVDKNLPILQHSQLRVFSNVEQLSLFNERGNLFKDFNLNSIKSNILDATLDRLGLKDNILQTLTAPISPALEKVDLKNLNEIVAITTSTLVGKIDHAFGENIINSRDRFDLAIKVADTESPLKLALINHNHHDLFVQNGYEIIQTPVSVDGQNYSLSLLSRQLKDVDLLNSRELFYLPHHIEQTKPTLTVEESASQPIETVESDPKPASPIPQPDLFGGVESSTPIETTTPLQETVISPKPQVIDPQTGVIEDTGMKMPGAKKDLYGPRLSVSQIQDMSLLQVKNLISRDKIWKKESIAQAKEAGRDIYIYLLTDAVRKTTNERPKYPLENATEEQFKQVGIGYYDAVLSLRDALLESKSVPEFIPKAAELYIRIHEDENLLKTYRGLDNNLYALLDSYTKYAATLVFLKDQITKAESDSERVEIQTALSTMVQELPPVQGTFSIYKKIRSAIDAKPFQAKLADQVVFRSYNNIDHKVLFKNYNSELSDQIMELLAAKVVKEQTSENEHEQEVSESELTTREILNDTSKSLDTMFKNYAKPRNLRASLKLSEVVVTENIASRDGQNISAHTLQATFGFKAVEFGEYLNQNDRQIALNNAYDGCFALAKALDIDPKSVGFNGMLGIAFGSRGSSAAMAHYEPWNRVINLTKNSGFGCFGHEFFHAYDHMIFSAIARDKPKLLMENVQPYLTRFANLNDIKSDKFKDVNQEMLQAAAKVNDAMYYLPVSTKDSLTTLRQALEGQVKFYESSIKTILNNSLKDQPELIELFTAGLPNLKENIQNYIKGSDKLSTELRAIIKFAKVHQDPVEFQKDALRHRRYNDVAVGLTKFLSENEYPIPRTELNKFIAQSRSEVEHERVFAAKVLGAADSNLFRSVVYREHKQLIRSQFALCALDYLNENSPEPISEDHQKFIALSLQTNDRLNSLEYKLKTDFYKNALMLEGLSNKKKPYWDTAHEMFARSGEQYLQVTLAKMNLRNDWLAAPNIEGSHAAVMQPHGVEKDAIIGAIREFTVKGLEYIQEHIAELRFADHQQYVKNALHHFQPGSEQHDNLVKWGEVLNNMSQEEYDQYWIKLMSNIESKADPELSKKTNPNDELTI